MKKSGVIAGHLSALISILIWGLTFISTKILLTGFTPTEILFFRFASGYLALLCICPRRLRPADGKQELLFAAAGLCGVTLFYLLQNFALVYSPASNISVVVSTGPFFTAIFARIFAGEEKLRPAFFLGFIAAISGIVLIGFSGGAVFAFHPLGDILAVLAAAVWAAYSLLVRRIGAFGYHPVAVARRTFFYGLLFMAPMLFLPGFRFGLARFADPASLLNMLFLGLAASALCFLTWNNAVKRLGAVETSVYIYGVPVVAVIASVLVLHEKITPASAAGIALAVAGLFVSEAGNLFRRKETVQK